MPGPQQITFTDPASAVSPYAWAYNPPPDTGESPATKQRTIERTSNTGVVGATKQIGDDGPYVLHWEPLVFSEAMEQKLWEWYVLCKKQSIYVTDFNGEEYEGQLITMSRQRIGVLGGAVSGSDITSKRYYRKYVVEFEVWRFISGVLATAGVTP